MKKLNLFSIGVMLLASIGPFSRREWAFLMVRYFAFFVFTFYLFAHLVEKMYLCKEICELRREMKSEE